MKLPVFWIIFLIQIVTVSLQAQSLIQAEYFLDADPGPGYGIPVSLVSSDSLDINFAYNLGNLSKGWHTLSLRTKDQIGRWSNVKSNTFYVYDCTSHILSSSASRIIKAEYFFDTDPGLGKGVNIPIIPGEQTDVNRFFELNNLSVGNHTVNLRVQDELNRWSICKSIAFTINPSTCAFPKVNFSNDTVTYGTPITFTNQSSNTLPGSKYYWDFNNDGITDDTLSNTNHTFSLPGVYPVKLRVANSLSCSSSIVKDVVTGPLPRKDIIIIGNQVFCEGDSVILTSDNNPPGYNFRWNTGDTTQAITVKSSGRYYTWITNSYGMLTKSLVVDVVVHPKVTTLIEADNPTGGASNGRIAIIATGGSGNYNYGWSNGATSPVINNLFPGSYSVIVNDGYCPVSLSADLTNIPVLSGNLIKAEYFFDTDPGVGKGVSLLLRANDSIEFPASLGVNGLSIGFHKLNVRTCNTSGNWSLSLSKDFYIFNESPQVVVPPQIQPGIISSEYFIGNDPGVGHGISMVLNAGDSLSFNSGIPIVNVPYGLNTISIRTKDALGKWSLNMGTSFFVYDSVPKTLVQKTSKAIQRAEYFFDSDPGVGNGTAISFNTSDSVTIERFLRVSGLTDGNHTVYVRVIDEASKWSLWLRKDFTVQHVNCTCPVVEFTADTARAVGLATHFTNLSTGASTEATYEWDVNNDHIVDYTTQNISHVYSQAGIYQAKLTVRNSASCYASFLKEVVVSPIIDTSLIINGNQTFCEGDSVILTAQTGYSYIWSNGSTARSITIKNAGIYSVRLTNVYGVQAHSRMVEVVVNPVPIVSLSTIDATNGNANGTAVCTVNGNSDQYTFSWSCGGDLPIRNNLAEGEYQLTVSNGLCPVNQEFHISNHSLSEGDIAGAEYFFDTDPGAGKGIELNIAGGDSIRFETYIPMNNLPVGLHILYIRVRDTHNLWGEYLSEPFFIYPKSEDSTQNSDVNQPQIISAEYYFDLDPGPGKGHPIMLNKADEITEDFAADIDGLSVGNHSIGLRVMDSIGKSSLQLTEFFFVYDSVRQNITVDQTKIVALEYFYDLDPGAGKGVNIPFTPTSNLVEKELYFPVTGLAYGEHSIYVRAKDEAGAWSVYNSELFNIDSVNCACPLPSFLADTVNPGAATTFVNSSGNTSGSTAYEWDINNDGTIESTSRNLSFVFPRSGVYDVKLRVINNSICQASVIQQVIVGPVPDRSISITGNTIFCEGDSVIVTASPGYNYHWWPNGETTRSITVKQTGLYYAWITSGAGIEVKSETVSTIMHEKIIVHLTVSNASGGINNGNAFVEVSGGNELYSYSWSSGSNTSYANALAPGRYSVDVTDGNCPVTENFVIENEPFHNGEIIAAEAFFNSDPGIGNGISIPISSGDTVNMLTGLSVAGLSNGINFLYVRVQDTYHQWSLYSQQIFYVYAEDTIVNQKTIIQPPLSVIEYFVSSSDQNNGDPGVMNGVRIDFPVADSLIGSFNYSADNISPGFYTINLRPGDVEDKWGISKTSDFYVYDTTHQNLLKEQPIILAAEYFFDSDPGLEMGNRIEISSGNQVEWTGRISIGALSLGSHKINIRTKDLHNQWSITKSAEFTIYDCVQPTANFSFLQTCLETPIVFNDISTHVAENATYQWDIDDDGTVDNTTHGSITHQFSLPGNHDVKLKITHNVACIDSITKTVVFPVVHLPNDTTLYTDQSLVLDAGPGYSYLWNTGATTQTITVDGATVGIGLHNYSVVVTNELSCVANDEINVTVILPPRDLVIASASAIPDTIAVAGDSISVMSSIQNIGSVSAIASVVNYYLSQDTVLNSSDQYLGYAIVPALPPGFAQDVTSRVSIPAGSSGGKLYILIKADGTEIVVESNENNNTKAFPIYYAQVLQNLLSGKVFLEGLFNPLTHTMNKARDENGEHWPGNVADQISVELHSDIFPYSTVYEQSGIDLMVDGALSCLIPGTVSGSYYVVIRHRNSIETWSSYPVTFGSSTIQYDFTTGIAQAFGNNMKGIGGQFVLFGGDATQDGVVDGSDMAVIDNAATGILIGYFPEDVNGDGVVDGSDMALIENNSTNLVQVRKP
ncbi:MAG: PKD domain-containing protein [Bacteroidetes bacterium]|nr:PKD domain-containing protein [Bacteroidota bacterium]